MYLSTYGDIGNQGCVVHLRLDDAPPKSHAYQCQIGDARLCKLLTWLHTTPGFGDRGIKLVTGPNDKDRCRHVCDQLEFPVEVEGNEDVDVDIWTLANADPLIMSRSTFALTAGILCPRPAYTYESWRHFDEVSGRTSGFESTHLRVLPPEWSE